MAKKITINKSEIQRSLICWFRQYKRKFPWRDTNDPFKILIAEKLLQQTRVCEPLISAYNRMINTYASPYSLANANIEEITEIIKPLGLSFRAIHILKMADEIVKYHNGQIPCNYKELMKLTGVGEYCSRAVLSFAFNNDVSIVDTNVGRFLYRVYGIKGKVPVNPSRKKFLVKKADSLLPKGKSKEFNLAILDLCAEICKPKNPKCDECPVNKYCRYNHNKNYEKP